MYPDSSRGAMAAQDQEQSLSDASRAHRAPKVKAKAMAVQPRAEHCLGAPLSQPELRRSASWCAGLGAKPDDESAVSRTFLCCSAPSPRRPSAVLPVSVASAMRMMEFGESCVVRAGGLNSEVLLPPAHYSTTAYMNVCRKRQSAKRQQRPEPSGSQPSPRPSP